ncbi:MAG: sigma-70 family RNA polymerase sigma factor [bacterium]
MKTSGMDQFIRNISQYIRLIFAKKFPELSSTQQEDIAQEVQIKIWRQLQKGRKIRHIKSYLWKVVSTTTLDMLNKELDCSPLNGDLSESNLGSEYFTKLDITADHIEKKAKLSIFKNNLEKLSRNKRIVIKLYLTGRNIREIAEFLNWGESQVNHLFYRGRDELKELILGDVRQKSGARKSNKERR